MTIRNAVVREMIWAMLSGEDYPEEITQSIESEMDDFTAKLLTQVVDAKLNNEAIDANLDQENILERLFSGDSPFNLTYVVEQNRDFELVVNIKLRGIGIDLNVSESLIIINTLAIKRAALRGGAWNMAGRQVEKALMLTLCKLYNVPDDNYTGTGLADGKHETEFFLISQSGQRHQCEFKLIGKGISESADMGIAHTTNIIIADKLSALNKEQLTGRGIHWVELRSPDGYRKFGNILTQIGVPHEEFNGNLDAVLPEIFASIF